MMPSTNTSLPPELVDMIIQHLSGHKDALQSCALVSRTWLGFSQRALFRDAQVNFDTSKKMAKLLDDLISIPHLQALVRGLAIYYQGHLVDDSIPLPAHMSCITSVLSLLPNLIKVAFFGDCDGDDIPVTRSYLDLVLNVLGNAPLVELHVDLYSVETLHHIFRILGGTNVKRVSLSGHGHEVDWGATRKLWHLPSLEFIRFGVVGLDKEFHDCLMHHLDLPSLKQCEIVTEFPGELICWHDLLLQGFPPLELFKLKLADAEGFTEEVAWSDIPEEDLYRPPETSMTHARSSSGGLPSFRALSDSKATIHFTELTFTCMNPQDIDALESEWHDSLAHPMFSAILNVHFDNREEGLITEAVYPDLADQIRLAFPQLARRGVLCLV
ncbi:hypothetical protein BDZ89DRAFT_1143749 [Hymenopellis radicata]|nr:hypothetical protein BDZ89DRAFT_1143749 [Hymenopellis radicata]